jgi:hypothetical protein
MRVSLSPQEFRELLLSHHPDSPGFDNDVVVLFEKRICAGCLFAYPAALATVVFFLPTGMNSIIIALLLAGISQLRRLTKNRVIQNFFRLVAGIALGFGLGGGYWAVITGEWLMCLLLVLGASLYLVLKAQSIKRKLEKDCPACIH